MKKLLHVGANGGRL